MKEIMIISAFLSILFTVNSQEIRKRDLIFTSLDEDGRQKIVNKLDDFVFVSSSGEIVQFFIPDFGYSYNRIGMATGGASLKLKQNPDVVDIEYHSIEILQAIKEDVYLISDPDGMIRILGNSSLVEGDKLNLFMKRVGVTDYTTILGANRRVTAYDSVNDYKLTTKMLLSSLKQGNTYLLPKDHMEKVPCKCQPFSKCGKCNGTRKVDAFIILKIIYR